MLKQSFRGKKLQNDSVEDKVNFYEKASTKGKVFKYEGRQDSFASAKKYNIKMCFFFYPNKL